MDVFYCKDITGLSFSFLNMIDDATGFQVVSCLGSLGATGMQSRDPAHHDFMVFMGRTPQPYIFRLTWDRSSWQHSAATRNNME
jgi:hypothetical protein